LLLLAVIVTVIAAVKHLLDQRYPYMLILLLAAMIVAPRHLIMPQLLARAEQQEPRDEEDQLGKWIALSRAGYLLTILFASLGLPYLLG
jgi:hypothetical protein